MRFVSSSTPRPARERTACTISSICGKSTCGGASQVSCCDVLLRERRRHLELLLLEPRLAPPRRRGRACRLPRAPRSDGRPWFVSRVDLSLTSSGIFIGSTATGAIVSQSTATRLRIRLLVALDPRERDLELRPLRQRLDVIRCRAWRRLRPVALLERNHLERHAEDLRDLLVELARPR